ncbi:MAG: sugar phosphorylase [Actinomycetota bacterium]
MSDDALAERVRSHLAKLYPGADLDALVPAAIAAAGIDASTPEPPAQRWTSSDAVLISYGDSVIDGERPPLQVLDELVAKHLAPVISVVHVLPFNPYSSDRGFSVIDYDAVDPALGTWDDLDALGRSVDLMADLVCNHASSQSAWFQQFLADTEPGRSFFMTAAVDADVSSVVRPRNLPLLHPYETAAGTRHAWCTFSADQVDLDYRNPDVLLAMIRVLDRYVSHGARFVRLDAVAYLWKELGTSCIHLPETHEVIRLWHTLLAARAPEVCIVTETNVPSEENLSYFGNRDEAHMIYNFSLPPLIVDALLSGRADRLRSWMMQMPPAPPGCTYLNFLASHDGIGVRPAEGLLSDDEISLLVGCAEDAGGLHGTYDAPGGPRPYELNVSLWDLLEPAQFVCAHAIMFGVEGIPAVWINSLLTQSNDRESADRSGVRRDITRARVHLEDAVDVLADETSPRGRASSELLRLLEIRSDQPAFDPGATQFTLQLGPDLFAFWRQSRDRTQSIFAVHNCTADHTQLDLHTLNLITTDNWRDLISGTQLHPGQATIDLEPYQSVWITNA